MSDFGFVDGYTALCALRLERDTSTATSCTTHNYEPVCGPTAAYPHDAIFLTTTCRIRVTARDRTQDREHLFAGSQYSGTPYSGTPYAGTPSGSGRASPFLPLHNGNSNGSQRFAEDLEGQNDERLEGISARVKLLKDVSCSDKFYAPQSFMTVSTA